MVHSLIRPSGMVVAAVEDITDMHKDMRHTDMHLLLKTQMCTTGAILDTGIISSQELTNSPSRSVNALVLFGFLLQGLHVYR